MTPNETLLANVGQLKSVQIAVQAYDAAVGQYSETREKAAKPSSFVPRAPAPGVGPFGATR